MSLPLLAHDRPTSNPHVLQPSRTDIPSVRAHARARCLLSFDPSASHCVLDAAPTGFLMMCDDRRLHDALRAVPPFVVVRVCFDSVSQNVSPARSAHPFAFLRSPLCFQVLPLIAGVLLHPGGANALALTYLARTSSYPPNVTAGGYMSLSTRVRAPGVAHCAMCVVPG